MGSVATWQERLMGLGRPWILLLLLLLPWWWRRRSRQQVHAATVSEVAPFAVSRTGWWRLKIPPVLRVLAVSSLLMAAAGPYRAGDQTRVTSDGISIILTLDISTSMLAQDFAPDNRLEVAKRQAISFVRGRKDDRIGLVIFAGEALTLVPATLDYPALIASIQGVQVMQLGEDGTAIGSGLATAVSRLRRMPGKEKVVVLLTDGENNRGLIDPRTAAQTALAFGVKVYTVGVGAEGDVPQPAGRGANGEMTYQMQKSSLDEGLLKEIAQETGAEYFRAADAGALVNIFNQIDQLERTPVESVRYIRHQERTFPFVIAALCFLVIELLVSLRLVVRIP